MDMDLQISCKAGRSDGMPKQSFQLKNPRKDGLILQIHHTVPGIHGEIRRVRFVHVTFNDAGEQLAASDHRGNIFIIDLAGCNFWLLVNLGLCSILAYSPLNKTEIVIGTANGTLNVVNTEIGKTTGALKGHTSSVNKLSFAKNRYCLSSSSEEAIIWDLQSNSQAHRLNLRSDVLLKQVLFMPVTDNILACFQDDAIHIWNFETFQCIKQIIPEAWKNHHVRTVAFTRNGRAMVMGGHTPTIIVFDLDDWKVEKVVGMPDGMTGIRHLEFIPGLFDGGANRVLGILSEKCGMYFLDTQNFVFLPVSVSLTSGIRTFTCSPNGKYVSFILHTGEINTYMSSKLLERDHISENVNAAGENTQNIHIVRGEAENQRILRRKKNAIQHFHDIHKEIQETLDLRRLRPILKEFGEYPESYRALIWKTILKLPYNKPAYVGLVNRDCNPAYLRLEEKYPLENRSILKNLKRLLSCLSHWCSLFGEVKFLPLFIFPFVKIFQNDPFACFEAVATIIVNWCQHWFEYFPFPPLNVLAMIENVLAENDPELMHLYYKHGVTSNIYAWPLLEVAFTEVFSVSEWMQFWDHVLSNEPAFLLMAVVAYNISCRSALQKCENVEDLEHFFHNQNAIDMKRFISKTYSLCRKTSNEIHPRQYLQPFTPLPNDSYPVFNQYPKFIVDYQAEQLELIRKEEEELLHEQEKVKEEKLAQEYQLKEQMQKELQEARLLRLEKTYKKSLQKEEERLANQRQKISALRRELRARELELVERARSKLASQQTMKHSAVFERLLDDVVRKREQDNNYMTAAEDELKSHLTDLLVQKEQFQMQLNKSYDVGVPSLHHQLLQQQQANLRNEIAKLRNEVATGHYSRLTGINAQISLLDARLQQAELDLAKEVAKRQMKSFTDEKNSQISQLETTTKALEEEVKYLLCKLTELRIQECHHKLQDFRIFGALHQEPGNTACNHMTCGESRQLDANADFENKSSILGQPVEQEMGRRNYLHMKRSSSLENVAKPVAERKQHTWDPSKVLLDDTRSSSYYQRQKSAVKSAMDVREQLLKSLKSKG